MPPSLSIKSVERSDSVAIQRVLVVDDSRLQRRILVASLRKWGFEVDEADSGFSALEICKQNPPDLVLSDWMMPGMTGLEFCMELRQLPSDFYCYFILLTLPSYAIKLDLMECIEFMDKLNGACAQGSQNIPAFSRLACFRRSPHVKCCCRDIR